MLGKQRTGVRFAEFSKIPCDIPNTTVHQRHTLSQDRGASRQGAATRHTVQHCTLSTRTAVPIRRNVSSSLKTTIRHFQAWSSPRNTVPTRCEQSRTFRSTRTDNREKVQRWLCTRNNNRPTRKVPTQFFHSMVKVLQFSAKHSSLNPGAKRTNAQSHKSRARSTSSETS